jgi:hypothetical protein
LISETEKNWLSETEWIVVGIAKGKMLVEDYKVSVRNVAGKTGYLAVEN